MVGATYTIIEDIKVMCTKLKKKENGKLSILN
jgi:hypothetical protein